MLQLLLHTNNTRRSKVYIYIYIHIYIYIYIYTHTYTHTHVYGVVGTLGEGGGGVKAGLTALGDPPRRRGRRIS